MNYLSFALSVILVASCSSNNEPGYSQLMQPSAIIPTDGKGGHQTFEYDDYGRIVAWTSTSESTTDVTIYSAHYSYPNDKIIQIASEEILNGHQRHFQETIQLTNGIASESEGTFIYRFDGNLEVGKTYRLKYEYDGSNHLTIVKHSEVVGIGDDIKAGAWSNPWTWENYLLWDDGNLKEFQDCQGNRSTYRTTHYDYSTYTSDSPIVIPMVVNSAHHIPLFMQGIFGLNSINLAKSSYVLDDMGNLFFYRQYSYGFEQTRVIEFTETTTYNESMPDTVSYSIHWTKK